MKLTPEHINPYLIHKTECSYINCISNRRNKAYLTGLSVHDGIETTYKRKANNCSGDYIQFEGRNNTIDLEFKLHLRPLSDIDKLIEINTNLFVPIDALYHKNLRLGGLSKFGIKNYIQRNPEHVDYWAIRSLISWHFDVFGLIESNLAIDINTLK